MRIPRVLSLSQQEQEKKAVELGRVHASIAMKKALVDTSSPVVAIITVLSIDPETILSHGQEKTGDVNLAHRYFFGYMGELLRIIAIQLAKMR